MKIRSVRTVKVLAIQFVMSATARKTYSQGSCFIQKHIYLNHIIIYVYYEYKCTTSVYQFEV